MLFEPGRHESLEAREWDSTFAHAAVRSITQDMAHRRDGHGRWPLHPLDDEGDEPRTGFKGLYLGSAGVLWALWYLRRKGAIEPGIDPIAAMVQADVANEADPDTSEIVPSYLMGRTGLLLALWRLTGSGQVAERLHEAIWSNIGNPTNEALWAAPGTMVAAWHLWQATGGERWRELFLENVEHVWRHWIFDETANCHLWTQNLYGKTVQYLGAGHGFAGNVYPLLKGASLLDSGRRQVLYERCVITLRATARFEDGLVNWPPGMYVPLPDRPSMLMQWCHGAPGIVTALSDFPRQAFPEMEAMLAGAGEAIWRAGPLAKGYGLCHGTAGNGCAFLKLHERTGEARWLDRARSFAMHALSQRDRLMAQYGQGRYTLWTGDAGLAVYLWHCIKAEAGLPALDILP